MAVEVRLEKMSDAMEVATVVQWLKRVGESVAAGEVIVEVETEKASVELEAPAGGVIARILVPDGTEDVPVGELLAVIEPVSGEKPAEKRQPSSAEAPSAVAEVSRPSPVAREIPAAVQRAAQTPNSNGERKAPQQEAGPTVAATPLAKKMAEIAGFDISSIAPGSAGRVTRKQVEEALGLPGRQGEPATARGAEIGEIAATELVPHNAIRKLVAARMTEAKQKIPHFYLSVDCNVAPVTELLQQLNRDALPTRLTLTSFVIKAAADAIGRVPVVNAEWTPSGLRMREVNIAVGVATPSGLVAPVIKHADRKRLLAIAQELNDLVERAKNARLRPQDTSGGSFTISNLGMFGVDSLFPIISPGQSCVLGIGASRDCPVVRDGALAAGKMMTATLSGDHRALDGAQGAEFLAILKGLIEEPARMIL